VLSRRRGNLGRQSCGDATNEPVLQTIARTSPMMSLAACDIRCNASMHVDPTAGLFASAELGGQAVGMEIRYDVVYYQAPP
jgi:hypothetical protein